MKKMADNNEAIMKKTTTSVTWRICNEDNEIYKEERYDNMEGRKKW